MMRQASLDLPSGWSVMHLGSRGLGGGLKRRLRKSLEILASSKVSRNALGLCDIGINYEKDLNGGRGGTRATSAPLQQHCPSMHRASRAEQN